MISIIVSSIKPSLLNQLKKNIGATIGIEFEIIAFDNTETNWGICKVYNHCAEQAKYENLVFCHEDILFHTANWGSILIDLLNINIIGLVGVAGTVIKSAVPAPWMSIPTIYYRTNALAREGNKIIEHINNPDKKKYSEVVLLDGFFLGTRKKNWEQLRFSENEIKGFHFYDIDFSLKQKKTLVVSNEILVEHLSSGDFGKNWIKKSMDYHKKNIPKIISKIPLSSKEIKVIDLFAIQTLIRRMITKQYSITNILSFLIQALCINIKSPTSWRLVISFFNSMFKRLIKTIEKSILVINKYIIDRYLRKEYNGQDFCIISSNCWAGHIYQALNKPYNTPFVGLFINAPDYIKLLKDFDNLMKLKLTFKLDSKFPIKEIDYPIGVLDNDIEIHFMHYKTEKEAFEKWERRKSRILKDPGKVYFKFDDRDFCSADLLREFHELPYQNKISFTTKKYNYNNNIKLKKENDLILLYSTVGLIDIPTWLHSGIIRNTLFNKLICKVFRYPKTWQYH